MWENASLLPRGGWAQLELTDALVSLAAVLAARETRQEYDRGKKGNILVIMPDKLLCYMFLLAFLAVHFKDVWDKNCQTSNK